MFVNLYTVFVLLAPFQLFSSFEFETKQSETEIPGQELTNLSNTNKVVTTADTNRTAAPVSESISEENELQALENWMEELPDYENESPQTTFIEAIAPAAILIADKYDVYPSVMLAQASLESSWGQSDLAEDYNNLMGTKGSWKGESITVRTREEVNGESVYINAGFSVYGSWGESLYRYGLLMANGLDWDADYYKGTWRQNTESYEEATAWLQGRYATDSAYARKLNGTIESFNLDQYDEIEPFEVEVADMLDKL